MKEIWSNSSCGEGTQRKKHMINPPVDFSQPISQTSNCTANSPAITANPQAAEGGQDTPIHLDETANTEEHPNMPQAPTSPGISSNPPDSSHIHFDNHIITEDANFDPVNMTINPQALFLRRSPRLPVDVPNQNMRSTILAPDKTTVQGRSQ